MKSGDELIRLCNEHIFLKKWQEALEKQQRAFRNLIWQVYMEGCNEKELVN